VEGGGGALTGHEGAKTEARAPSPSSEEDAPSPTSPCAHGTRPREGSIARSPSRCACAEPPQDSLHAKQGWGGPICVTRSRASVAAMGGPATVDQCMASSRLRARAYFRLVLTS